MKRKKSVLYCILMIAYCLIYNIAAGKVGGVGYVKAAETQTYDNFKYVISDDGADEAITITKSVNKYIQEVKIPKEINGIPVKSIGDEAFSECDNLISVTISEGVASIGNGAFYSCDSLGIITIPEGVEIIGDRAFKYCYSLISAKLPESITSIGESAFEGCGFASLNDVSIPKNITNIGKSVFGGCALTSVKIPEHITSIGDDAFKNCRKLTSVEISKNVTSIGNGAFDDCWKLADVTILGEVTNIGERAFADCPSLININLPDSVTNIGNMAFVNDSCLTSITLPKNLTSISSQLFASCINLKTVVFSDNITSIGYDAFGTCWALTDVQLPKNLVTIGNKAFDNCKSLTYIEIPDGVKQIGAGSFVGCERLKKIVVPKSVVSIQDSFPSCATIYCYKDSYTQTYAEKYNLSWKLIDGSDDDNPDIPDPVDYSARKATMNWGDQYDLAKIAKIPEVSSFTYESDNTRVASVETNGKITANGSGVANIYAYDKAKYGTYENAVKYRKGIACTVTVIDTFTITAHDTTVLVGNVLTLEALTTSDENEITWSVGDNMVLSIKNSENGKTATVTGLKAGETKVTATQTIGGVEKSVSYVVMVKQGNSDEGDSDDVPVVVDSTRLFYDYHLKNAILKKDVITIYGNGGTTIKEGSSTVNYKQFICYTDILASNLYTENKGKIKTAAGKVVAGVTMSDTRPLLKKGKIVDERAAKLAKVAIKNGQITVTAVGKGSGTVYLWVMDANKQEVCEYIPILVNLAPKKLLIQDTKGNELKNLQVAKGEKLTVQISGVSGTEKTNGCTYTAVVDSKSASYLEITQTEDSSQFTLTGKGVKNNKDTKATFTVTCKENGKNFKVTITIKP